MTEKRKKGFLYDVFCIGERQATRQHIVDHPSLKLIKQTNDDRFEFSPGFRWKLGCTRSLANSLFSIFGGQCRQSLGGFHLCLTNSPKCYHCAPGGSPRRTFQKKRLNKTGPEGISQYAL